MQSSIETPRFLAFINPKSPDVFRSILSTSDVWNPDPFDVPEIHMEAREAFRSMIERARERTLGEADRLWLLRGDPGSGKTHLIAALRAWLHESASGIMAYMQMQTGIPDYARYIAYNVIESLSKPLRLGYSDESVLQRLSRAIFAEFGSDDEDDFDARALARSLIRERRLSVDAEALSVLLTLQKNDPVLDQIVSKYFRGDPLSRAEQEDLGGIQPREDPYSTITFMADIARHCFDAPLVICLDQLDDFYGSDRELAGARFNAAVKTVRSLLQHDNIVALISILDEQYRVLRRHLLDPEIQRVELGMAPTMLRSAATAPEVEEIVRVRLAHLFESNQLSPVPGRPLYPYTASVPQTLAGMRYRNALEELRKAQLRSLQTLELPFVERNERPVEIPIPRLELTEAWNDFSLSFSGEVPPLERLPLLAFAVERLACEAAQAKGARLEVQSSAAVLHRTSFTGPVNELVAILDQKPQFGHLMRAVNALAERAESRGLKAVAMRSSDFPAGPRTQTAQVLGSFLKAGHRRIGTAPSTWRKIAAYREFCALHNGNQAFADWAAETKPLASEPGLQALLELDAPVPLEHATIKVKKARPELSGPTGSVPVSGNGTAAAAQSAVVVSESDRTAALDAGAVSLGVTDASERITLEVDVLRRHLAVMGTSGSGKTTLAFSAVEGLLLRGIPVVLLDRKGDLASYADERAWQREGVDDAARAALRERADVQLFTPGIPAGRNLRIAPLPERMNDLQVADRTEAARASALGLASMLEYGASRKDRLAALTQAIETYGEVEQQRMTLDGLIAFIADQDPRLISAIGALKPRVLEAVANDLSGLRINAKKLFAEDAEPLDIEMLLGWGSHAAPGKTRLSILYLGGLGEGTDMLFWVSRFLAALSAHARKSPKPQLQCFVFFDEADCYLPATSKPVTKEPMESGFKRFRSAGIGIGLGTQSPGDIDYKSKDSITTWLVGRVSEPTALEKLKKILGSTVDRLPRLTTGSFAMKTDTRTVGRFQATLPVIMPLQLEESEIVRLAAQR